METTFVSFKYKNNWYRVKVTVIFYLLLSLWIKFFLLFLYTNESASKCQYDLTFPKFKQLDVIKINSMKYLLAQLCKILLLNAYKTNLRPACLVLPLCSHHQALFHWPVSCLSSRDCEVVQ